MRLVRISFARISFARLSFALALAVGALVALPAQAWAQPARRVVPADASSRAALVAERQRVRAELERANAEIDALKRSGGGLRQDYRLRERLADAEALARRLTELDASLGRPAAPADRGPGAEPRVSAADGPAELDAKADILADQAQRLTARGDQLLGRARDLRARQTLRRRVGQMERDPFSPLEGSKRRAMTGSFSVSSSGSAAPKAATPDHSSGAGATTTVTDSPPAQSSTQPAANVGAPVRGGADGAGPAFVGQATGAGNGAQASATPGVAVSGTAPAPAPTSSESASSLSVQLRDLLDPTTLAEIQHLEGSGGSGPSYEALERAGAALKARAERLRQQSAALRAHAAPRAH